MALRYVGSYDEYSSQIRLRDTQFLFHGHEFILYLDKLNSYNITIVLFRQILMCYCTVESIYIL